jgi:aldose 1-epimerase
LIKYRKNLFGKINDIIIYEFTLANSSGMSVSFLNYGATISKLIFNNEERPNDIVLGFNTLKGYLQKKNRFFGSTIGRYANRIEGAKFILNETEYFLTKNHFNNCLHGGNTGFDKIIWDSIYIKEKNMIKFSYFSKNLDNGFPGNLNVSVLYTLSENNELTINYKSFTDYPTHVNLTNHSYFNISGNNGANMNAHLLQIFSNDYLEINNYLIPTGNSINVSNTLYDFRTPILIDNQKLITNYDHNWIIDKFAPNQLNKMANLYNINSKIFLEILSTYPGLQFYGGNNLDGTLFDTKKRIVYNKYSGICLEPQFFPNSPNMKGFPSTLLTPEMNYDHTIIYKLSVKN